MPSGPCSSLKRGRDDEVSDVATVTPPSMAAALAIAAKGGAGSGDGDAGLGDVILVPGGVAAEAAPGSPS